MNIAPLQQSVINILQQRIAASASLTYAPMGFGVALALSSTEDSDTVLQLENLVATEHGRSLLVRLATIAIDAYLHDLVKDMDQGTTPLGFTICVKTCVQVVPSSGMADYWRVPYEYGSDESG